jgi:hypothetical protein
MNMSENIEHVGTIELGGATLCLRPQEAIAIFPDPPAQVKRPNVFAVCAVEPPEFPGKRELNYRADPPRAIIAITYYPNLDGWGFIHLEPDTKRVIGDLMFDKLHCENDRWYWLVLGEVTARASAANAEGEMK